MLRRDFLQAEIQKLAQILAKALRLKSDGKQDEAQSLLEDSLQENLGLPFDELLFLNESELKSLLLEKKFSADKLDKLAEFFFEIIQLPLQDPSNAINISKKVLVFYDVLEKEYHQQSFENIRRRSVINQFLARNNE